MNHKPLTREDYEEPCCPLSTPSDSVPICVGRMIDKLDEYLNKNDYAGADRHLRYWRMEAEAGNDLRGKLTVLNEQMGLYRKMGKKEEGMEAIREGLALAGRLDLENTVTLGTTLVNAATGLKSFGEAEEALKLYQKARTIYEALLKPDDGRLGGLYNNQALALAELGAFREAEALYQKAISIMEQQEYGELEVAITWCNLADLASEEMGLLESEARVSECLETAEKLLDTPSLPRNGYYAFVCEKCASTFGYYGYFLTEQRLLKQAREIYERA